jgi:hypothetical protein
MPALNRITIRELGERSIEKTLFRCEGLTGLGEFRFTQVRQVSDLPQVPSDSTSESERTCISQSSMWRRL